MFPRTVARQSPYRFGRDGAVQLATCGLFWVCIGKRSTQFAVMQDSRIQQMQCTVCSQHNHRRDVYIHLPTSTAGTWQPTTDS